MEWVGKAITWAIQALSNAGIWFIKGGCFVLAFVAVAIVVGVALVKAIFRNRPYKKKHNKTIIMKGENDEQTI